MRAAHHWGKAPSEFFALGVEDRAWMLEYTNTVNDMAAYDALLVKIEMQKHQPPAKK